MANAKKVQVLIVGAGVSGIGAGIKLLEEGISDFVILEKTADVGGSWRDNTYPGCACDVPSALYSYSFAQKPDWSRAFAPQPEILQYVKDTAACFGVDRYIRFREPVEHAQWDDAAGHWVVRTPSATYHATVMIGCTGYLHEPLLPEVPGQEKFKGLVFHSSRWRHDVDLRGKRVAVIGTGASAIQFVPEIQQQASQVYVLQRSPQWILPKPDHPLPAIEQNFFKLPFTLKAWRGVLYSTFELFGVGFRRPALLGQLQKVAEVYLRFAVPDAELRRKLTPDYALGCKRVLFSNNYYQAVSQPNVEVLATALKEFRGNGVVGADGSEREVDVVIYGTGFYVAKQPVAARVFDAQGRSLASLWEEHGMEAYRGTTIKGLPNFFLVLGPNLAIGHSSAFIVIEAQIRYIVSALRTMRERRLARIEVRPEVQQRYNRLVQRELQHTVWNTGGCSSYYLDENGKNSIGFPWSTLEMRRLLKEFDARSYRQVAVAENVIG